MKSLIRIFNPIIKSLLILHGLHWKINKLIRYILNSYVDIYSLVLIKSNTNYSHHNLIIIYQRLNYIIFLNISKHVNSFKFKNKNKIKNNKILILNNQN
jgi:hypothetical protein